MGFPADLPGRRHMSQVPVGSNSDPQAAGEVRRMNVSDLLRRGGCQVLTSKPNPGQVLEAGNANGLRDSSWRCFRPLSGARDQFLTLFGSCKPERHWVFPAEQNRHRLGGAVTHTPRWAGQWAGVFYRCRVVQQRNEITNAVGRRDFGQRDERLFPNVTVNLFVTRRGE